MDFVDGSFFYHEDSYLLGVPALTSAESVKLNFESSSAEVVNKRDTDLVGTGAVVKSVKELTVVVKGDVNGDARVSTSDYILQKKSINGATQLEGAFYRAADVNDDNEVNSADYLQVKKYFTGKVDLYENTSATPYEAQYEKVDYSERKAAYRMDRDKINIGVFAFTKAISDDAHMSDFKDEFGGDFILFGSNSTTFYKMCDKHQVGFLCSGKNLSRYTYGNAPEKLDPTSFADIEAKLAAYNDNYAYLWADDVFDEANATYFDWMAGALSRYNNKFSDRFIFYNLHPVAPVGFTNGHGAANYRDYISQYIKKIDTDYISFDIYPFDNQFTGMNPYYLENLDIVSSACRESGRDFWIITQAGANETKYTLNEAQVAWQTYTSLAFGAKTVIYGCYTPCWWADTTSLVNIDGEYTDLWYSTCELNEAVHGISSVYMDYDHLGVAGIYKNSFNSKQMRNQIARNNSRGYGGVRGFTDIESTGGLLMGSFEKKDGNGYAMMLVESSDAYDLTKSSVVTFRVADPDCTKVTAYPDGVATVLTPVDGVYTVELTSGEGCFVTVE